MVRGIVVVMCFAVLFASNITYGYQDAQRTDERIKFLTQQIESAGDSSTKAQYLVYRARQYKEKGKPGASIQDYMLAIEENNAGWIWKELGYACLWAKRYEEAYQVSQIILEDFPYLSGQITDLHQRARDAYTEEYRSEHPPVIIYDQVAPDVRTRFDVKREKLERLAALGLLKPQVVSVTSKDRVYGPGKPVSVFKTPSGRKWKKNEQRYLDWDRRSQFLICDGSNDRMECRERVARKHRKESEELRDDPESYYLRKNRESSRRRATRSRDDHEIADTWVQQKNNNSIPNHQNRYAGNRVKDIYGRDMGKVDPDGRVKDNYGNIKGKVDDSGNMRSRPWNNKAGEVR